MKPTAIRFRIRMISYLSPVINTKGVHMDITQKVAGLAIVDKSFTPDGESRKVEYSRMELTLNIKGTEHKVTLNGKVSEELKALCAAADDVDA